MSYNSKSIKSILDGIADGDYVLPAIQREFVWSKEKIKKLFDSLMRDYPINSFLFWKIKPEKVNDYQFYKFIRAYHQLECRHNPRYEPIKNNSITAILDGQQRLTSIYIGLKGSYAEKIYRRRWDDDTAFPKKMLYLNLIESLDNLEDDSGMLYEFEFLQEEEAQKRDEKHLWFKVGHIFDIDIAKYCINLDIDKDWQIKILSILNKLYEVVCTKEIINYYEENNQDIEHVLNIFTRTNMGGTILSYSDLLLSTATALWRSRDAREEINNITDSLQGLGLSIDKDFVMKASLVLTDLDISYKVKNFNKANMETIEQQWEEIKTALLLTAQLIIKYGYRAEFITSYNALLPLAYHLKKIKMDGTFLDKKNYEKERKTMTKWFAISIIKKAFASSTDTTLRQYREILQNNLSNDFPIEAISGLFKFSEANINQSIDEWNFGDKTTFSVLFLLQDIPQGFELHVDHLHPKSAFNRKILKNFSADDIEAIEFYKNNIVNLQILRDTVNISKKNTPLEDWLKKPDGKQYALMIPSMKTYSINECINFWEERRKLLCQELLKKLQLE